MRIGLGVDGIPRLCRLILMVTLLRFCSRSSSILVSGAVWERDGTLMRWVLIGIDLRPTIAITKARTSLFPSLPSIRAADVD
jgi:hypothetical protein